MSDGIQEQFWYFLGGLVNLGQEAKKSVDKKIPQGWKARQGFYEIPMSCEWQVQHQPHRSVPCAFQLDGFRTENIPQWRSSKMSVVYLINFE